MAGSVIPEVGFPGGYFIFRILLHIVDKTAVVKGSLFHGVYRQCFIVLDESCSEFFLLQKVMTEV